MHYFNDNQEIRDISVKRMEDLEREKEVEVRIGVAGILEDANAQLQHGLTANFGVRNAGLPAVFQSDIDVSDGEMLKSTLENARNEITNKVDEIPTTLFRCIAKRLRPNGKTWVRCENRCIRGEQYCPIHLQVTD